MRRIQITVAYDGTNYCGWQWQPNGITIEEVLNRELSKLLNEPIAVIGASRTDSGVHSLGNLAVFNTNARIPAEKLALAVNKYLPEDIVVQESKEISPDFHPRKCNSIKTYEYRILNRRIPRPDLRLNTHFVYAPLDVSKMQAALDFLLGEHDFKSFCTVHSQVEETVRRIYEASVTKSEDVITIRLTGNGFLMHMIRIIAGTLIKVGMGVYPPQTVKTMLEARDRYAAGPKAPAKGLTMVSFVVEDSLKDRVHIKNEHWEYTVWQQDILSEKKAYIVMHYCEKKDLVRTFERLVLHALQNGARDVYLCIKDKCGKTAINGGKLGPYTLNFVDKQEQSRNISGLVLAETEGQPWYVTQDYWQAK